MQKKISALFLLVSTISISACSKQDFHEYNRLDQMRILALKASSPEANPGTVITFKPVISDATGGSRSITYSVMACADPGIAQGAYPACTSGTFTQTIATNTAVTTLTNTTRTAEADNFNVTIPATFLDNYSTVEQYVGVPYIVTYKIQASDGTTVESFKRVIVSSAAKTSKNSNPTLSQVKSDGSALSTALPVARKVTLEAAFSSGSAETYSSYNYDGTFGSTTETLVASWFVSEGTLDVFRTVGTDTNGFYIGFNPTVAMVVVLRDDRGGEDFKVLQLQ